jgi:sulfofructosephosphate aldolase
MTHGTDSRVNRPRSLQTDLGAFAMLALDQRESLRGMFSRSSEGGWASDQELIDFKAQAARIMSPFASGILLDRPFGLAAGRPAGLSGSCGLIAAADVLHQKPGQLMTDSSLDPLVTPDLLKELGAVAIKFLILWHPGRGRDARQRTLSEFTDLARRANVLSLIEGVVRTDHDEPWASAQQRHDAILSAAEEFAEFDPDIYKAEIPGYVPGDVSRVAAHSGQMTAIVPGAWVVLSNGVEPAMFPAALTEAVAGGASGFLAGRAIWQDIVGEPDLVGAMRDRGISRLKQLREIAEAISPTGKGSRA